MKIKVINVEENLEPNDGKKFDLEFENFIVIRNVKIMKNMKGEYKLYLPFILGKGKNTTIISFEKIFEEKVTNMLVEYFESNKEIDINDFEKCNFTDIKIRTLNNDNKSKKEDLVINLKINEKINFQIIYLTIDKTRFWKTKCDIRFPKINIDNKECETISIINSDLTKQMIKLILKEKR